MWIRFNNRKWTKSAAAWTAACGCGIPNWLILIIFIHIGILFCTLTSSIVELMISFEFSIEPYAATQLTRYTYVVIITHSPIDFFFCTLNTYKFLMFKSWFMSNNINHHQLHPRRFGAKLTTFEPECGWDIKY